MSSKTLGIVVVVLIVAGGIWAMTRKSGTDYSSAMPQTTAQNTDSTSNANVQASASSTSSSSMNSDYSDAALNQDAAAINAQMSGLSSDTAAAQ